MRESGRRERREKFVGREGRRVRKRKGNLARFEKERMRRIKKEEDSLFVLLLRPHPTVSDLKPLPSFFQKKRKIGGKVVFVSFRYLLLTATLKKEGGICTSTTREREGKLS